MAITVGVEITSSHNPLYTLRTSFSSARSMLVRTLQTYTVRTTKNLTPCRHYTVQTLLSSHAADVIRHPHGRFPKVCTGVLCIVRSTGLVTRTVHVIICLYVKTIHFICTVNVHCRYSQTKKSTHMKTIVIKNNKH